VVADVQIPIIGVDLLGNFGLLIDCSNNRILDGITSSAPAQTGIPTVPECEDHWGHRSGGRTFR